jgi:hypothetical protein
MKLYSGMHWYSTPIEGNLKESMPKYNITYVRFALKFLGISVLG